MHKYSWLRFWKSFLLWLHVAGVVGAYAYAYWQAPFSKKDRVRLKKLATESTTPDNTHTSHPMVSIILPARNEESNIQRCVTSLLEQDYACYEVIVVDDNSTDQTGEILDELAQSHPCAERLRLLHVQALPAGWCGKPYAIHIGVQKAQGEWLLLTDADAWHSPGTLRSALTFAQEEQAELLTLGTKQEVLTFWERVMMPMAYIGLSFRYPVKQLNTATSAIATANGQYILIQREAYEQIGGYQRHDLRNTVLERYRAWACDQRARLPSALCRRWGSHPCTYVPQPG